MMCEREKGWEIGTTSDSISVKNHFEREGIKVLVFHLAKLYRTTNLRQTKQRGALCFFF